MRTLKIDNASSNDNGIWFYSKRHKGHVCIATLEDDGSVTTRWTTVKEQRKEEDRGKNNAKLYYALSIYFFYVAVIMWAMSIDTKLGMRFWCISTIAIRLTYFFVSLHKDRKNGKQWAKFHSAEHMVLNGYSALKRVPTLDEVSKYSRFSNSCGTNTVTIGVLGYLNVFIATWISDPLYKISFNVLVLVLIVVLLKLGMLNFLQVFTTEEATEQELKVAIEGLNTWYENESKEKTNFLYRFLILLNKWYKKESKE